MPITSGGATSPFWFLLWRQFVQLRFSVVFLGKLSSPSAQNGSRLYSLVLVHSPTHTVHWALPEALRAGLGTSAAGFPRKLSLEVS